MNDPSIFAPCIDAVVIGRNEGARLARCLGALQGRVRQIIYVDSGSQDGSCELAESLGARVLCLPQDQPFTAARARNFGLRFLQDDPPDYVQMVDGDCSLDKGWLEHALQAFAKYPKAVVICGRRREVQPELSIYNRLCDREWNSPLGEALACGGDALCRYDALVQVGLYREDMIAGEEPELCQRLRRQGGQIWRIEAEMTRHDAAMLRFSQWWRRARRAGFAFAQGAALHGAGPDRHWRKERNRALLWGVALPLTTVLGGALISAYFWGMVVLWPLQMCRLGYRWRAEGRAGREAAVFLSLAKLPEALGAIQYYLSRLRGQQPGLIEYK